MTYRIIKSNDSQLRKQITDALNALETAQSAAISDDAYGAGWNGVTDVAPSKNAVYDKFESLPTGGLTASVKTANYTITGNEDVGVNSSGGTFTITLKASPVAGDVAFIHDTEFNCGTTAVSIDRNGSTIGGAADDAEIDTDGGGFWFICDVDDNWEFTPITSGGLSEAEVDARVVSVASGLETIYIPANLIHSDKSFPTAALTEYQPGVSGKARVAHLAFDPSAFERAMFSFYLPERYDGGVVYYRAVWTNLASTNTGTVVWALAARCLPDLGSLDQYTGTVATSSDAGSGTANRIHYSPSAALTIAGATPSTWVFGQIYRDTDTFTGDAALIGIEFKFNASSLTDD